MIRTKIVEVRETDMETANELLKDPHWNLVTVLGDRSTLNVKYVLKRKGTYDDKDDDKKMLYPSCCTTDDTSNAVPVILDVGCQYICTDMAEIKRRYEERARSFGEIKAMFEDTIDNFSSTSANASRPESLLQDHINCTAKIKKGLIR